MNDEIFVTGLTTDQDNLETIENTVTTAIEEKTQLQFHNRAERRKFAKKLGKKGRTELGTISETAKKLQYIDLIQKIRALNKEKENEDANQNN